MLKKSFLLCFFLLCFAFVYCEEASSKIEEVDEFGLSVEKKAVIEKLYEREGLLNDWFKGCMRDFVKYAKEYDSEKVKTDETIAKIKNNTVKMVMFAVLSALVIPSFQDSELSEYAENEGFTKTLDSLSKETTNYIDGIGEEIISNLGLASGEVNREMLDKYVDITINSIKEYLEAKEK